MKKIAMALVMTGLMASMSIAASAAEVQCPAKSATQPAYAISNFKPDTGKVLSIETGKSYTYKVKSIDGVEPTLVIPGQSFVVTSKYSIGNDFYFVIKAVGNVGESAGIYINDETTPRTIVSIVAPKKAEEHTAPKKDEKPASKTGDQKASSAPSQNADKPAQSSQSCQH